MEPITIEPPRVTQEQLCDPGRLQALAESGLSSAPDAQMDLVAERVRRWLDVPVAVVSLVQSGRQVFPGMAGLPQPWAERRATPLTHSFCQHVVITAAPLVVEDARDDSVLRDNLAIDEIGVVAYAGMPLTDAEGRVLGSLAAIDSRPRAWTATQLEALGDLAQACSAELQLRLARFDADRERARRDALESTLRAGFEQSQTLLGASQAFHRTASVADVREQIAELTSGQLRPTYLGIGLLGPDGRLRRFDGRGPGDGATPDTAALFPVVTAVRSGRIVHYPDRDAFDADHPAPARQLVRDLGLHAVVVAPLASEAGVVGALVLGWDRPRDVADVELLTLTTIAGFAAQALHRAELLEHRIGVAHQMQRAMLTPLPDVPGLVLAARYQPADSREHVGGDWYDVAALPCPDPRRTALAVSVGDIVGHGLDAALVMGQVRPMLRQAGWDRPGAPPSQVLTALETAGAGLGTRAVGTAVLAHVGTDDAGRWSMTWANAGHPPPLVVGPDGTVVTLDAHDHLFGIGAFRGAARHDHHLDLPPGSTLFLYSDGLVERRDRDLDVGLAELTALLATHRHLTGQALVDHAVAALGADSPDDVVAFALHVLPGS